jgi:hypothetical protein
LEAIQSLTGLPNGHYFGVCRRVVGADHAVVTQGDDFSPTHDDGAKGPAFVLAHASTRLLDGQAHESLVYFPIAFH